MKFLYMIYIRIFFFGLVVAVCGKPREPYDRGGRIWSLAVRTNRASRNKPAASASKLRQTAYLVISLQQTARFVINLQQNVQTVWTVQIV